jgi:hypothetical protein
MYHYSELGYQQESKCSKCSHFKMSIHDDGDAGHCILNKCSFTPETSSLTNGVTDTRKSLSTMGSSCECS